jgi:transposase
MAAFTSQEQHSYVKIEVQRRKKSAKEIFNALQEACGTYALSYVQVTRWVKEFKDGRDSIKDNHRPGRNVTATDSYSTVLVKKSFKLCQKDII